MASLQEELKKYAGMSSRVSAKPLRRSHQVNQQQQNRERDIENNTIEIAKLRSELELLQRHSNPQSSKETVQGKVQEVKEKIIKTKQKVKELKIRSR